MHGSDQVRLRYGTEFDLGTLGVRDSGRRRDSEGVEGVSLREGREEREGGEGGEGGRGEGGI